MSNVILVSVTWFLLPDACNLDSYIMPYHFLQACFIYLLKSGFLKLTYAFVRIHIIKIVCVQDQGRHANHGC